MAVVERDAARTVPHASPLVRRFARELGVDLIHVAGRGQHDRILREDVQAYVRRVMAGGGDGGGGGTGELFDLVEIAPLQAYLEDLREWSANSGTTLSPLPFLIKAATRALTRSCGPMADGGLTVGASILLDTGARGGALPDPAGKGIVELARLLDDLPPIADGGGPPVDFLVTDLSGLGASGHAPPLGPGTQAALTLSAPTAGGETRVVRLGLRYRTGLLDTPQAVALMAEVVGSLADIRRLLL